MLMLDVETQCSPLTDEETALVAKLKAESAQRIKPEADRIRGEYIESRAAELAERRGIALDAARTAITAQCGGELLSDVILPFDRPEFNGCTVGDVLADPDRFINAKLSDPIEGPAYGKGKAQILKNKQGIIFIKSFAHGGMNYTLHKVKQMFGKAIESLAVNAGATLAGTPEKEAALTEASRGAKQVEKWRPILDEFLASPGIPAHPHVSVYPPLPDASYGLHPLCETMRTCIERVVAYGESTKGKFKINRVVEVLAILKLIHNHTYNAIVRWLRNEGCTVNERAVNLRADSLWNEVENEVCPINNWVRDVKNQIIPNVIENVEIFCEFLGVQVRWNQWVDEAEVRGFNWPGWTYLDDSVYTILWTEAHRDRIRFNISKEFLWAGLIALARKTSVDPALEELDRLEKSWDGQYRLATWLSYTISVPCDLYHQAVAAMIFGNMVRRIREPGCKADYVAVFWGGEGTNKSKLIQAIAPRPEWFSDRVTLGEEGKELRAPRIIGGCAELCECRL